MKYLEVALNELQSQTIGLFKHKYSQKNDFDLVVKNDNGLLVTVSIGGLAGYITTHIPQTEGKLFMFPNGKNLYSLKEDPYELYALIKDFINS